jgi:hypothetical protein
MVSSPAGVDSVDLITDMDTLHSVYPPTGQVHWQGPSTDLNDLPPPIVSQSSQWEAAAAGSWAGSMRCSNHSCSSTQPAGDTLSQQLSMYHTSYLGVLCPSLQSLEVVVEGQERACTG